MAAIDVLRHLVVYGPARNDAEREALLAQLEPPAAAQEAEQAPEAPPAPEGEFE